MASNDTTRQVLFFIIIIIICFYSLSYSSLNICCIFLFLYKLLQQSALKKKVSIAMVTSWKMQALFLFVIWKALPSEAILTFHTGSRETEKRRCNALITKYVKKLDLALNCWFSSSCFCLFCFFFTLKPLPQSCNKPWPGSDIYYLLLFRQVTKVACCACTDLITVLEVFKIQSLLNNGCCSALFKHIHSPLRLTQEQVNPYHKGTSFCVIQQFSNPNHNSCRARQVWAAKSRF